MRPARLVTLVGVLTASAGLYLGYLRVDRGAFASLAGGAPPTLWEEFGSVERLLAVLVVAALVGLASRPHLGRVDAWGGAATVAVALAALAGALVVRSGAAADASLVSAALGEQGTAAAGVGFLVVAGGAALAAGGAGWDLVAALGAGRGGEPDAGEVATAPEAAQSASTARPPASEATLTRDSTRQP